MELDGKPMKVSLIGTHILPLTWLTRSLFTVLSVHFRFFPPFSLSVCHLLQVLYQPPLFNPKSAAEEGDWARWRSTTQSNLSR